MSIRLFLKPFLIAGFLVFVALTLWGAGLLLANQETVPQRSSVNGNLVLTVITENRTPLAEVTVMLKHTSQPHQWSLKTDSRGRIVRVGRQGLPQGTYQITAQKEPFQDHIFSVMIPENGSITKVITLKAK